VGAVLAAFAYDLIARPPEAEEEPAIDEPAQGTAGDITGRRETTR
jgi:hypothetical protein